MKKITYILLCLIIITSLSSSISATDDNIEETLSDYIQKEFEKTKIPAMSVEIVDSENILLTKQYGEGVTADTPFILGSISKSFTALAISQLVEDGLIDVTQPFCTYLNNINKDSKTTVKQLLNHTSGIHTNNTMENYNPSDIVEKYEYANVNYNLLGLIIEQVSGISYGEYIKKNIFEPLGMTNSYVSIEEAKENGLIKGYRNYFGVMIADEYAYPKDMVSGWMTLSAAYLISTANDMGKYLQFYLGGNPQILSNENINTMFHDTTDVIENYEYGYGWGISKAPEITMYVHGGNVENYTTYMVILPNLGKAIVVLSNACDFFSANDMIVKLTENIGCKLSGVKTVDIDNGAYITTHIILDVIMFIIISISILSIIFIRKSIKKSKVTIFESIRFILLHVLLPSLLLFVPSLLGSTLWIGARFAPDLFFILVFSSSVLFLTGICKIVFLFINKKKEIIK